jgi:hypothetical protein
LSGGYSSAWSADVNGEEKLKVENFFLWQSALRYSDSRQEKLFRALWGRCVKRFLY